MGQRTPAGSPEVGFTSVDSVLAALTTRLGNRQAPSVQDWSDFEAISSQVNEAAIKIGILQNHLDAATEASEVQKMNVEIEKSNLLDADLAETTSKLARSNALLQAAQAIMSRIDINNLFQKL
jgi:flagellin-like hook-associated protein FlgL